MSKKIISLMLAAIAVITATGCGKKKDLQQNNNDTNGENVSVYTANLSPIETTVTYTGEVKASESVSISSKVSAKAEAVYYHEGDYVVAGTVIAKLDSTDAQLTYNQAEASYNSAVAAYNMTVNSSTKQAQSGAQQAYESAQLAYNTALTNYEREKQLYEQSSEVKLAEQRLKDAQSAYERQKQLFDNDTAVIAAKNALTTAQTNLDNTQKLFDMGAASQIELDTAKNNVENAKASYETAMTSAQTQLDSAALAKSQAEETYKTVQITASAAVDAAYNNLKSAENALANAKENIGLTEVSTSETITSARASVDTAKAALDIARNNLQNTTIVTPISGYIATKNINVGQMVAPGVEIFSVKNDEYVDAEIAVTESVISYIKEGTTARISIKSAGIENIEGIVTLVNPVKDQMTGMYTVKVSIHNVSGIVKVGMFADITLVTQYSENALVIPTESIMRSGDETYVYTANDNIAEKRVIIIGIENSEYSQVLNGIEEGEQIVVDGKEYISETNNVLNITSEAENKSE